VLRFIDAEKANHSITTLCRVMGVSKSGFYAWRSRRPCRRDLDDRALQGAIEKIHAASRGTYGAPRIHAELRLAHGVCCSKKRVARLMKAAGVQGCHRRRRRSLTRVDARAAKAPDLVLRGFSADRPDRLWVTDITYVPTRRGFAYLAAIVDVFSRKVVGWALSDDLSTGLVSAALDAALACRRTPDALVLHSDRGCQFTSRSFRERLAGAGIDQSMGRVGDCYDNALMESFFATLECELFDRRLFSTTTQARLEVFSYIEGFYNPRRRHSALDYLSPDDYERRHRELESEPLARVH
jgi:putative transposase